MKDILEGLKGVRLQKLSEEQCRTIHDASLRLLQTVGVEVHHERARALLAEAGACIEGTRVRIPPELVEWALEVVPAGFTLHDRDGEPVMPVTGTNVFFGNGSETPNILDHRTGERRRGSLRDVEEGCRVIDALPNLDFLMSLFVPWDVDPRVAYLEQFKAMLRHSTKPTLFLSIEAEDVKVMVAMLEAVAGGADALRARPRAMCHVNVTHPFRHEYDELEKLVFLAERGVPHAYSPVAFRGTSGPITQAGSMAVCGAGELVGLVLSQLVREGCPIAQAGGQGEKLDMRSMISVYSNPEKRVGFAEMARFRGVPHFGLGGASESKLVDEQSVAEASLGMLVEALAGSNLVHDVGYMESGMSNSLVQIVILDEVIGWIRRFMAPIVVDDETLALDLVERVAPMGDYLGEDHTMAHFGEDWYPSLFDHSSYDRWVQAGSLRLSEKAAGRVDELLASHQVPDLPEKVLAEIDGLIATRAAGQGSDVDRGTEA